MNALGFAGRSLVRQPARAALGVLGVAAVGALLFDMLMLSEGLITSMRDLLEQGGWEIRISAGDLPGSGPPVGESGETVDAIAALPSVRAVLVVRTASAEIDRSGARPLRVGFDGASVRAGAGGGALPAPPWTIVRGRAAQGPNEVIVNQAVADAIGLEPGETLTVRASCSRAREALPPVRLRAVGIATFPFESVNENTIGGSLDAVAAACGDDGGSEADFMLVTSTGDADLTAADVRRAAPGLNVATNEEVVGRIEETGFTYFRQISSVLTAITVSFAVLLITVLLTVSVNQRLGEVAALRALGFSRTRVVKDVLSESALIVGSGGLLSLPLGLLLAEGLDRILKDMPGIPASLHFFVLEPGALAVHVALLVATSLIAAAYPVHIVSRLPIAATLRSEVVG